MAAELGTLGISEEHLELHASVRRWVGANVRSKETKAFLDLPTGEDLLPSFWDELIAQRWLGLRIDEEHGGEGYGLPELAIVLEELGRACAPGPFLPTVAAGTVLQVFADRQLQTELLPAVASGDAIVAIGPPSRALALETGGNEARVHGQVRPVMSGGVATHFLLPCRAETEEGTGGWCVLERGDVDVRVLKSVDGTRRLAEVSVDRAAVSPHRLLSDPVIDKVAIDVVAALVAAESVGAMAWCTATAAEYASERVQFGRPIGQFQAVKHRCADMLLRLELSRAAAWDVARAAATASDPYEVELAACVAGAVVPDAALETAKDCVQVLGGIGYTWEHDAHLHLKRALANRHLVGEPGLWKGRVADLALGGTRRSLQVELPDEAERIRADVQRFIAETKAKPSSEWTREMADHGFLVPYWPEPWGRDASPIEQLVIDDEFAAARLRRPHLQVGAWVLPTIINHGSREQQERWVAPTLRGEVFWCQLFSEPGAGSDLASLTTKAVRDEERGGWLITGQKVWTTMAHLAQWGLLLARTDPGADKHDGITAFVVDMTTPGIDIRPLRELTGAEFFNEVFFTEAFVPDDCVIGDVNRGWEAARTTLANERVSMGSGSSFGPGVEAILAMSRTPDGDERETSTIEQATIGELVAEGQALAVMGLRITLRALAGASPGAEASVRKLVSTEHDQRIQEVGLSRLGPDAAVDDGAATQWIAGFLGNRALSIAGGTSDVQRNIVAERLLGLPKD